MKYHNGVVPCTPFGNIFYFSATVLFVVEDVTVEYLIAACECQF